MKALLLSLSFALSISAAVAGPSVSGGVAFEQEFERCISANKEVKISIKAVASPELIFGFLAEGDAYNTLKCHSGEAIRTLNGEEVVWVCSEQRVGEGRIETYIFRTSAGVKYGVVYRYNILQKLQEMSRLACDQTISNK